MPQPQNVRVDVSGIRLTQAPDGKPVPLGEFGGVQVLVLLRHRH